MPIELPDTRLPSPIAVPPMTSPGPPPLMPALPFGTGAVPFTSVPMRFAWIVTSTAPSTSTPLFVLPEIRFSPFGPPTRMPDPPPPWMMTPVPLGTAPVPVTSVPM